MENSSINLNLLQHSWTAEIKDRGGHTHIIWHTSWPMERRFVAEVLWVASDYPKFKKERETNPFIIREYD
jgi:hypothetical protein